MGFEIAIGRRREGQDAKGKYGATTTKSLAVSAPRVWKLIASGAGIAVWLKPTAGFRLIPGDEFETVDGYFGEVRTTAAGKRARLYWRDPNRDERTIVELSVVARPGGKSILVINHTGFTRTLERDQMRARWRVAVEAIAAEFA